jgi:hypothetical protein
VAFADRGHGVEREQRCRQIRGRRVDGEISANCGHVAELGGSAGGRRAGKDSAGERANLGRVFNLRDGGGRADYPTGAATADVAQPGVGQIDEEADGSVVLGIHVLATRHNPRPAFAALQQFTASRTLAGL